MKYIAELAGVEEVALHGTAELGFWQAQLSRERLLPIARNGAAQVLITATNARYAGVRFRELSIAVAVRTLEGSERKGYFLAQAFNSSRLFAFAERTLFSTPYDHGAIAVDARPPASVEMRLRGKVVFSAAMAAGLQRLEGAEPTAVDELWEGPIFLPNRGRKDRGRGKLFFARIAGRTLNYAFAAEQDRLLAIASAEHPPLAWLSESGFAGGRWALRSSAEHARSKTYAAE